MDLVSSLSIALRVQMLASPPEGLLELVHHVNTCGCEFTELGLVQ